MYKQKQDGWHLPIRPRWVLEVWPIQVSDEKANVKMSKQMLLNCVELSKLFLLKTEADVLNKWLQSGADCTPWLLESNWGDEMPLALNTHMYEPSCQGNKKQHWLSKVDVGHNTKNTKMLWNEINL